MGGRRGLEILRATLENMAVPVIAEQFTLPRANEVLRAGELLDPSASRELHNVISSLIGSVVAAVAA